MNLHEAMCFRNCFTKIDVTFPKLSLEGTKAEQIAKRNMNYLKKHDPDFKNIEYDPLTKDLEKFKGKFIGGVDRPII